MPIFRPFRRALAPVLLASLTLLAACGASTGPATSTTGTSSGGGGSTTSATRIGHVFVIVLENENGSTTFGPGSPAPYLSTELLPQGTYIQNYYGIGHNSNPNYLAMISGQGPNVDTQADCQIYSDFITAGGPVAALDGQAVGQGCVYPSSVQTLPDQLEAKGYTWRGYMEDMGNTPARETATCGHPALNSQDGTQTATAEDNYATRHNPFVYFHSIIDDQTRCDAHVVSTAPLASDLQSIATTANFTMIVPGLCHDGHDASCASGETPGGLGAADNYLRKIVPMITASPAFKKDGLLVILFDEASSFASDATACCGESAGPNTPLPGISGLGGGITGAVVLSPFVKPGTVTQTAYNHYGLLRTIEDIFGLDHLGYAAASGVTAFGKDVCSNAAKSCSGL